MYWNYGKRIIQTALWASGRPEYDLVYITNFKCGPDSFIKQYIREALGGRSLFSSSTAIPTTPG